MEQSGSGIGQVSRISSTSTRFTQTRTGYGNADHPTRRKPAEVPAVLMELQLPDRNPVRPIRMLLEVRVQFRG